MDQDKTQSNPIGQASQTQDQTNSPPQIVTPGSNQASNTPPPPQVPASQQTSTEPNQSVQKPAEPSTQTVASQQQVTNMGVTKGVQQTDVSSQQDNTQGNVISGAKDSAVQNQTTQSQGLPQAQKVSTPTSGSLSSTEESPTTVNSTAASLGNVDPGLSAPAEKSNPVNKVQNQSGQQTQTATSSSVNTNQQTSESMPASTLPQDSPQGIPPAPDNIQTQEKANEVRNQEAGNSGKNN